MSKSIRQTLIERFEWLYIDTVKEKWRETSGCVLYDLDYDGEIYKLIMYTMNEFLNMEELESDVIEDVFDLLHQTIGDWYLEHGDKVHGIYNPPECKESV